ncbi:MAG: SPFH domain-containing protein [Muribaculaceae bacterium]|nr:SPFH domain-containing protein [Muribaculaceae bacterium]
MESKEFNFKGLTVNGFLMLFVVIAMPILAVWCIYKGIVLYDLSNQDWMATSLIILGVVLAIITLIFLGGFLMLEPNTARVTTWFGKYSGTFTKTGFYWINPFYGTKKVSLRARNLDAEPIKVNDKVGNPVMIGLVLVWRLKDTYKALFEVDSQTMASTDGTLSGNAKGLMRALEAFVSVQSYAALRQVAGQYAYDDNDEDTKELTLRSGGEEINEQLEGKLNERLSLAGIEVVEARINYLAYAPEIAAVMLRRQQASAIITAREKIVEGAVSMVKMALDKLSADDIVELDEDKKAAMVSNLLVVLCADESAQPVVNTGTLNQ